MDKREKCGKIMLIIAYALVIAVSLYNPKFSEKSAEFYNDTEWEFETNEYYCELNERWK